MKCDQGILNIFYFKGKTWSDQRRFVLRQLRDFGFARAPMEVLLHQEASDLCQLLEESSSDLVDLSGSLSVSVVNSLWHIIVGEKFSHEDPELKVGRFGSA